MSKIVKVMGAIVFSALMYATPIITTLMLMKQWNSFLSLILVLACMLQFSFLVSMVMMRVEEDE